MPAAFFDLDRTLIGVNSARLFLRHEYDEGRVARWPMIRASIALVLYHLALVDLERSIARAARHYAGQMDREVGTRVRRWFDREIALRILPGAIAAVAEHRRAGDVSVVLTASSSWLAEAAASAWGLDDWIANAFEADPAGRLTGGLVAPLCVGTGKVERAEAWARSRGIDLAASAFYTDSYTDLPMLERVGRPRVVNPDPRLARLARRRGWPVLDWRE